MADSKFDSALNRMTYLMEFKSPSTSNLSKPNAVAFHTVGADGKVYGILREGTKYYIKTTEQGKENLAESYSYIGGFMNRKANEFPSYDKATKHLEVNMINLNESYGKHEDVSVVDAKSSEKNFTVLTEEARKELNRMTQIFENSTKIGTGNVGDLGNDTGHASADNTKENNKPFEISATAGKGVTDSSAKSTEVKEPKMDDDSMRKGGESKNDNEDVPSKIKGGLGSTPATEKPKGGKAVMVNEGYGNDEFEAFDNPIPEDDSAMFDPEDDEADFHTNIGDPAYTGDSDLDPAHFGDEEFHDNPAPDVDPDSLSSDTEMYDDSSYAQPEKDLSGMPSEDEEEPMVAEGEMGVNDSPEGPDEDVMKNYKSKDLNGKHISWNKVDGKDSLEPISEGELGVNDAPEGPDEDVMKNQKSKYLDGKHISWNKVDGKDSLQGLNESATRIAHAVYKQIMKESNTKTVNHKAYATINRIVKEEINRLNDWGKHPRYGQEPMTLPDNHEVTRGTASRDWNDDSAKGKERYGKKIGSSAPFTQTVDDIADNALAILKESLGLKKK